MKIRWNLAVVVIALSVSAILAPEVARAASSVSPPALPAPSGKVVNVSTESQLQNAVRGAAANSTVVIAPGTYNLTGALYLNGVNDVTLRGATNNRDDVVLAGKGMNGAVDFGVWTNGQRITIANLTIRDVANHAIILNAGAQSPRIYNVHLINTGQQFIKSNPDGSGGGVNGGIVEYSVIEYATTSRDDYTNGVDVHTGSGWNVRNNLFRNLIAPGGALAGPAILMWNGSSGAVIEGNTFLNCQREISMGLTERSPDDNNGGIVRNNFIYRAAGINGDVGILVADSPGTQVLHNTVMLSGTYPNAIEYRFGGTRNVLIANNLTSAAIQARDGATGTVSANYVRASAAMFVNAAAGDLHLVASATAAIDKVASLANAPNDWDDQARPASGADYGADEFDGGTVTPPANQPPSVSLTSPASGTAYTAPTSVPLSAQAADNDGSVASVSFYNGTTLLGSITSSPYTFTWMGVAAGTYALTAVAVDSGGAFTISAAVGITVSNSSGSGLPAPWASLAIGAPPVAGSAAYSNGTFTVEGGGTDIWGSSDQFRFVYQPLTGDGEIMVRVASLTDPDPWAKAGVMIRQQLTADSPYAMALVSSENGVAFQRRGSTGGDATHTAGVGRTAPYWVRLVRAGSTFSGYSSADGATWSLIGRDTISMATTVYVGLAVTGHNGGASATGSFTGISVTDTTTAPPPPAPPPTPPAPPSPLSLVFVPSADHATNVTSYTVQIFEAGADPAAANAAAALDLGKPAIVSGTISVDILPLVTPLPSGSYFASVTAVGLGGSTRGASSNAFVR